MTPHLPAPRPSKKPFLRESSGYSDYLLFEEEEQQQGEKEQEEEENNQDIKAIFKIPSHLRHKRIKKRCRDGQQPKPQSRSQIKLSIPQNLQTGLHVVLGPRGRLQLRRGRDERGVVRASPPPGRGPVRRPEKLGKRAFLSFFLLTPRFAPFRMGISTLITHNIPSCAQVWCVTP